jgi:hypothetical protein
MKQDKYHSLYGNKKGFILTVDLMLGTAIVFIVLVITAFFINQGSAITLSDHQLVRIGSDVITILDENEVLDTLDENKIKTEIEKILPGNYGMLTRIQGNFSQGNGTIEIGGEIPANRLLISGRKVAVTNNDTYLKLTYFVWTRNQ